MRWLFSLLLVKVRVEVRVVLGCEVCWLVVEKTEGSAGIKFLGARASTQSG